MKRKLIIKDVQHIIKAVGLSAVVTVIFTSFTSNIINPIAHQIIPDSNIKKQTVLSFKNVSRSLLEAVLSLFLFFILYEIFIFTFVKKN